jgi:hypothetical protein
MNMLKFLVQIEGAETTRLAPPYSHPEDLRLLLHRAARKVADESTIGPRPQVTVIHEEKQTFCDHGNQVTG